MYLGLSDLLNMVLESNAFIRPLAGVLGYGKCLHTDS